MRRVASVRAPTPDPNGDGEGGDGEGGDGEGADGEGGEGEGADGEGGEGEGGQGEGADGEGADGDAYADAYADADAHANADANGEFVPSAFDPFACGFSDGDIVTAGETCLDCMIAHCKEEVDIAKSEWEYYQESYADYYDDDDDEIHLITNICHMSNLRTCMLGGNPAAVPAPCTDSGACFCQGLVSTFGREDISFMPECPADFLPPPGV